MDFDQFCRREKMTTAERQELLWYLLFLRMRRMMAWCMGLGSFWQPNPGDL